MRHKNNILDTALEAGKLPPQVPELEQAVLGALLLEKGPWTEVSDLLTPEMFYVHAHQMIYKAAHSLFVKNHPVDILTVTQRLRHMGELDICGGAFYISQLTNKVGSTANVEYHARIIMQAYIGRELIVLGNSTVQKAYDHTHDVFELLDETSVAVTNLYSHTQSGIFSTAEKQVDALLNKEAPKGYFPYGIPALDDIAVFPFGLPTVVAGRPGMCKSIVATEVMWNLTSMNKPVLLFSPEMTERQVTARILARESGVPYRNILKGNLSAEELHLISTAHARVKHRLELLLIDPQEGLTPTQCRARTERAMKSHGIVAAAVDHIQKMETGDPQIDRDEVRKTTRCMNGLTSIAKHTDLPFLIMCQLSREVEKRHDKRPMLSDLKWSGAIEEDAALVIMLYRAGYYTAQPPFEDDLEMIVAKQRDGGVGTTTSRIIPALNRIGGVPHSWAASKLPDVALAPRAESPVASSDVAPF